MGKGRARFKLYALWRRAPGYALSGIVPGDVEICEAVVTG
jgi:hypothetical protein